MTSRTTPNGVNVQQLVDTVNAIKANPTLARFRFRTRTEWVGGGHSRTCIQSFYGAGQEDVSRQSPFILEGDEPPVLLGTNAGPNAVETALAALASCISVGVAYNAAAQGIAIDEMEIDVEGDLDLHGFLGLSEDVRPGYEGIRLTCRVRSDAPPGKAGRALRVCPENVPAAGHHPQPGAGHRGAGALPFEGLRLCRVSLSLGERGLRGPHLGPLPQESGRLSQSHTR